jgi:hypothetical protein
MESPENLLLSEEIGVSLDKSKVKELRLNYQRKDKKVKTFYFS